jgi:peptide/nickel transport system permease protein
VSAAASKDFAVVQGISLVLVAVFVIMNTIVDILYALLDPRVTLGTKAA